MPWAVCRNQRAGCVNGKPRAALSDLSDILQASQALYLLPSHFLVLCELA